MGNSNILKIPGFPKTWDPFRDWLENLPPNHTFKPMKVNGCIVTLFLQTLWSGTLQEDIVGRVVHFHAISPLGPPEGLIGVRVQGYGVELYPLLDEPTLQQKRVYEFSGSWVDTVSRLQWNLGISASQAEREYKSRLFLQCLQKQHLNNCFQTSSE